jgi:two-component system, chemotaxis family, response regulator Rcp1
MGLNMVPDEKKLEILLIEDNHGDVRLIKNGLKNSRIINNISVVGDGEEAIAYLTRAGGYSGAIRPDIILLDFTLPRKDGREVLTEIKKDESLRQIPVVVLISSKSEKDVLMTYQLHANCFLTKPLDLSEFTSMIQSFEQFWLAKAVIPSSQQP